MNPSAGSVLTFMFTGLCAGFQNVPMTIYGCSAAILMALWGISDQLKKG